MVHKSESITEGIFREFYGANIFIEKTAIPKEYGFKSKRGTDYKGYPDFFLDSHIYDFAIVVEAKKDNIISAEEEVKFYMQKNNINKDILGIAISGQSLSELSVSYWLKLVDEKEIIEFSLKDELLSLDNVKKVVLKVKYKEKISEANLITTLKKLNKSFNDNKSIRVTDRSLLFSGLMIALKDDDFRSKYRYTKAPSIDETKNKTVGIIEAEKLNDAILNAINGQITGKISNLSKSINWKDKFSFIRDIDYSLIKYIEIIKNIEENVFAPFQSEEKHDVLGRAYRIFLSKTGATVEDRNIIITPDHIKKLMIKLARIDKDDIVLDTCTGTGGFMMEAMETMILQADGNPKKIENIKTNQLIGFENDAILFALACTNMFLHGDGRSNMIFRSSLLNDSECNIVNSPDNKVLIEMKEKLITKVVINPPYENNLSIRFVKQALEYLQTGGRLVIIMPTPTLKQNQNGLTEAILAKSKLDFVIKMPNGLFSEQKRTVSTSIFGFTKSGKHNENDEVIFYLLDDDGLVSVQHKGRIDKFKRWELIEKTVIEAVLNSNEKEGVCEKRKIYKDGALNCYGFPKHMSGGNFVKISELFDCDERGTIPSDDGDDGNINGCYDFVTASETWKKHSTYTHDEEALIIAVGASGSLGRTHYIKGKFSVSNLCLFLKPHEKSKYKINLEFYNYYFASIRKQLVSDLADGTSKLTINPTDLKNYYIEYIDYKKQNKFISSHVNELNMLKQKYMEKIKRVEAEMRLLHKK